jgi:hypothetical protein
MTQHGMASHCISKEEARTILSTGKIKGTVFWDAEGHILVEFLPKK